MLVVGSTALKHHGILLREPRDVDVWCTNPTLQGDSAIVPEAILGLVEHVDGYATPNSVYTIKCSHLGWDIKFEKHLRDVLLLKMKYGCELNLPLYNALVAHWKVEHGNKEYLSLYKDKRQFFNDHVTYVYDHDYLHELVAYPNKPVYTECLKLNEDVAVDREKFFLLPFEKQVRMFREEISVIAAERWLIPPKVCGKMHWAEAYRMALKKTIVSLTKNWATDFLVQNIEHFVKPEYAYFEHMFKTLKEGEKIMANMVSDTRAKGIMAEIAIAHNATNSQYPLDLEDYSELVYLLEYGHTRPEGLVFLDQDGGGEGGSEHCELVFKWKGRVYKLTYSYYSHRGYDFDYARMYEVAPVQKTITVYE